MGGKKRTAKKETKLAIKYLVLLQRGVGPKERGTEGICPGDVLKHMLSPCIASKRDDHTEQNVYYSRDGTSLQATYLLYK